MAEIPEQPTGLEPLVEVYDRQLGYKVWKRPQPSHCHLGHPYRIGTPAAKVTISWVGCRCANAAEASNGHSVYYCRTLTDGQECRDERWQPVCLDPSRQAETDRRGPQ
jgi:hypothetical protein